MVKAHLLLVALATTVLVAMLSGSAVAWSGTFHLDREWVKMWINQDGSIDLFYNITLSLDSGDDIHFVTIGQPNSYYTIGPAADQYGNTLLAEDAREGTDYKVKVTLNTPLRAGQTVWFTLMTNVAHMIYDDTPGRVGMQFNSTWYAADVRDLRILILLPPNVTESMVGTSRNWTSTNVEEDRLGVYWETQNLSPNEQYSVGVSFPEEYVQSHDVNPPPESANPSFFVSYLVPFFFFGVVAFVIVIFAVGASKKQYLLPTLSMETLGIKHGLTAVEASYLLDMKPTQIVTEILYSLLKKRAAWVEDTKPSIRLRIMPEFQDKTSTADTPLRYYEIDFMNSIRGDGTLDEAKLAHAVMALRENVEERMRGYCRRDTVEYYKGVVAKAWQQVEQAGTPDIASKAYDEQLLWLLLDPNVQSRTQTVFQDRIFMPSPTWLWYWYGYRHYYPNPTYRPNIEAPAQSAKPPTIPGSEFANNMAAAVTGTANGIVVNLEKFANSIVPMPAPKASNQPAHHNATCVCACHACACACACVSCACACAGGGVG
jgi:hypothetical protein